MTEAIAVLLVSAVAIPLVVTGVILFLDAVQNSRQNDEPLTINLAPHIRSMAKDEDSESTGLICMFCGATGYETQEELEAHIDSHPYTKRREN